MDRAEVDLLRTRIADFVSQDPAKAAKLLTLWLAQPRGSRKNARRTG